MLVFSYAGLLQAQSAVDSETSTDAPNVPAAISGVRDQNASPFGSSDGPPIMPRTAMGGESGNGRYGAGRNRGSFNETPSGSSGWDNALTDAFRFGMRSSRFGSSGGGHAPNADSLFQMGSRFSGDLGSGKSGAAGTALGILPDLSNLERNGLKLPVNSSAGKFQFSYHDQLGPGGNAMGGGIGRGSAQATFNSTGLKDDMLHFSAAAMFGGADRGMGSSLMGSGAGASSFGAGAQGNGMFSLGNMNGAGIGSGSGGFSSESMHGDMGGFARDGAGGMHGMGGEGGRGRGAESGPSVSLKLTFK